MWNVIAGIGGSLAGALINREGQSAANRSNEDIAKRATHTNIEEAKKNREWQEMMSNSAHQRQVKDLEAAGLNPILAAQGGASSGGGATASAETATVDNIESGAFSSAMDAANLTLAVKKQKEEIGLIKAQKKKTNVEADVGKKMLPEAEMKNVIFDTIKDMWGDIQKSNATKVQRMLKKHPEIKMKPRR